MERSKTRTKAPDARDMDVGRRIRAQRLVCRMSQTELANNLGVTFQQVQKYEKGVNRVGAGRLSRIADVLGGLRRQRGPRPVLRRHHPGGVSAVTAAAVLSARVNRSARPASCSRSASAPGRLATIIRAARL